MIQLNTSSIADAAVHYRGLGWWPIPLRGKCPITNWTTDPLLTEQQLRLLFPVQAGDSPHLNLGIRMGDCSQLVALDIDGRPGRDYLHQRLTTDELAEISQTLQFATPRGHRLLYRYPEQPLPSRSYRDPANNQTELVRILSDGTQTVAPPSDIDGLPYLWLQLPYPLAPWPAHILAKLEKIPGVLHPQNLPDAPYLISNSMKVRRASAYLRRCDPAIAGQGGHDQTYKIAVRMVRGFGLSYHEALMLMTEIYNPTCRPPWTETELAHKIESALADTNPCRNML